MSKIVEKVLHKWNKMLVFVRQQRNIYTEIVIKKQARMLVLILGVLLFQLIKESLSATAGVDVSPDVYLLILGILFLYLFGFTARKLVILSVGLLFLSSVVLIVDATYLANQLDIFAYFLLVVVILLQIYSMIRGDINGGK